MQWHARHALFHTSACTLMPVIESVINMLLGSEDVVLKISMEFVVLETLRGSDWIRNVELRLIIV